MDTNWRIRNTVRNAQTGFVTDVDYKIEFSIIDSDTNTRLKQSEVGTIKFTEEPDSVNVTGFIPYDELELEDVIDWVKDSFSTNEIKIISDYHQLKLSKIEIKDNVPKILTGVPKTGEEILIEQKSNLTKLEIKPTTLIHSKIVSYNESYKEI